MPDNSSNNKRIAKNTLLLYFRMMLIMVVSLYTSRVILNTLGVEDYGIYQTVGGVVAMLSYINGALNVGSSRFLTFELGRGNFEQLRKTFSSVLTVHVILAIIVLIVGETVGLWFVYNKLVIPENRMFAAVIAYHLSIVSAMITITQVPYGASIISHEKMNVFAYVSIIEAFFKLGIVYFLYISDIDKLILYASLYFAVSVGIMMYYRVYCLKNFEEAHYTRSFDKNIVRNILSYSGWNLFATTSVALCGQGITIITNMFFNPSVVTARAIANQVNGIANQFVQNFRTAVNPQIVKKYAAGDNEGSKLLLLTSTRYSFFMMLALTLPITMVAKDLLQLWLGSVPEYAVIYLQLAIWTSLFAVFDLSFYTALYAKGQIKENSLISSSCFFIGFVAICILFKLGYSPVSAGWVLLISQAVIAFVVKPILLVKIASYKWKEIISLFTRTGFVLISSLIIPVFLYFSIDWQSMNILLRFLGLTIVCLISVALCTWTIGIDKYTRTKLIGIVKKKLNY